MKKLKSTKVKDIEADGTKGDDKPEESYFTEKIKRRRTSEKKQIHSNER
jgi:hypothetical protein